MTDAPAPKASARPTFRLVRTDAERALQALLKIALRRFGLRCLSVEKVPPRVREAP